MILGNPHRSGADAGNFSAFPHREDRKLKNNSNQLTINLNPHREDGKTQIISQIIMNNSNHKSNKSEMV